MLWTTTFFEDSLEAWGLSLKIKNQQCEYKCYYTVDKSLFPISDAVVYHGFPERYHLLSPLASYMYPLPKPKRRKWNQVWVYLMMEPPAPHYETYNTMEDNYDFNWTMTYRRDSDILLLYGDFEKINHENMSFPSEEIESETHIAKSKALVAGMISECDRSSGRDVYIRELQKYIPVDLYGKCGTLYCSKSENCYKLLASKYKFWLSFENSLCVDYVTEKFFRPLQYGIIPVYYGHPTALKHTPPGSYINSKDFESPEALGKYLLYLDKDDEEYLKYFEWKKYYKLQTDTTKLAWCALCTKLHTESLSKNRKTYESIADWFLRNNTDSSVCSNPSFHF